MRGKNTTEPSGSKPELSLENQNPNSHVLNCLTPEVALMMLEVSRASTSLLGWPPSIVYFLENILLRIAEGDDFECRHEDFAKALWPHLDESAGKKRVSKRVRRLIEIMAESGYQPVWVPPRRTGRKHDGAYFGLPTLYQKRDFWTLFRAIQDKAIEIEPDLFSLSKVPRRKKVRELVNEWLKAQGCKPVERKPKDPKAARAEKLRRKPNEDFSADLEKFAEKMKLHLAEYGEIDERFRKEVARVHNKLQIAVREASQLINQNRRNLKLVGGQPK